MKKRQSLKRKKPSQDLSILLYHPNPFIGKDLSIDVSENTLEGVFKSSDGVLVPHNYFREKEASIKLYTCPNNRKAIASLSPMSSKLFLWIMYEVERGVDHIQIKRVRMMKELGIKSINTYKRCVLELSVAKIVYKTPIKDLLWVNPAYFFKGNRVSKYNKNINIK